MSSNGGTRGLFAGGPHWLFGPRIIIIAVALLLFVSARLPLSHSFSFAPLVDLRSGRCIATRIDLSLYPVGHEEASQPRARHDRAVRPEDGRHAEDRKRQKLKCEEDVVTKRGTEDAGEQRRRTRNDRCDEKRNRERSESIEEKRERKK